MARRNGRKGRYLASSDYSSMTEYSDKLQKDFWGDYGLPNEILQRNLQEISTPLNDPYPVPFYRGPTYEQNTECPAEIIPLFIGKTTRRTPTGSTNVQATGVDPGIGSASIGCTFRVS